MCSCSHNLSIQGNYFLGVHGHPLQKLIFIFNKTPFPVPFFPTCFLLGLLVPRSYKSPSHLQPTAVVKVRVSPNCGLQPSSRSKFRSRQSGFFLPRPRQDKISPFANTHYKGTYSRSKNQDAAHFFSPRVRHSPYPRTLSNQRPRCVQALIGLRHHHRFIPTSCKLPLQQARPLFPVPPQDWTKKIVDELEKHSHSPFVKTQPNHHPFLSDLSSWHSLTYVLAQPHKMDNTAPTFEQLALAFPEDRHYALRRFLTPLHHGDVHRDLLRVLYRPRRVWCRCGAGRRSTARYRARAAKARAKARMRAVLQELERRLPPL